MATPSLLALTHHAEQRAHDGLGWIIAHVDELRPAAAMTRWTNADTARVAAAECAVMCRPLARLTPVGDRVLVALLGDWVRRLAVPELIAWGRSGAPAWYRPLVLTAGALADAGIRALDLEMAVRLYGSPSEARFTLGREEHAVEAAYWWSKLRQSSESSGIDTACEREIRRLLHQPVNEWTARALNHAILCQSDFGKTPERVSSHARQLLYRTKRVAVAKGHVELAAESAFAWWCLDRGWNDGLRLLYAALSRAQRSSGAFVPHLRRSAIGINETERCYRSTLMGVLGCLAVADMLRTRAAHDGSSELEKTAKAAQ